MSRFPFRRIVGIDASSRMVDVARNNLRQLGLNRVQVICGDAGAIDQVDDINYFYLYNPFPENVMREFMRAVAGSQLRRRREIRVIYLNPISADVILQSGFREERRFLHGSLPFVVYSSGLPSGAPNE